MSTGMKVLNVLGIIVSIFVSIVLVLTLTVSPMVLSALSLLQPQTLADTVTQMDFSEVVTDMVGDIGEGLEEKDAQMLETLLTSDATKEILETYTQGVADVLAGKETVEGLTAEKLQQIVDGNMDQIAEALQQLGGEFADMTTEEISEGVQQIVDENAEEILEVLPKPEELKESLVAETPEIEQGLALFAAADTIKLGFVGLIAVLCIIVFVCRLFDWRGFKWLAVDLLIAGVFSGGICAAMSNTTDLLGELAESSALLKSLLGAVMGNLNSGMIIRTVIMVVVAVVFMAAYLVICKFRKKQAAAA